MAVGSWLAALMQHLLPVPARSVEVAGCSDLLRDEAEGKALLVYTRYIPAAGPNDSNVNRRDAARCDSPFPTNQGDGVSAGADGGGVAAGGDMHTAVPEGAIRHQPSYTRLARQVARMTLPVIRRISNDSWHDIGLAVRAVASDVLTAGACYNIWSPRPRRAALALAASFRWRVTRKPELVLSVRTWLERQRRR
jgi:hypothetical protein